MRNATPASVALTLTIIGVIEIAVLLWLALWRADPRLPSRTSAGPSEGLEAEADGG